MPSVDVRFDDLDVIEGCGLIASGVARVEANGEVSSIFLGPTDITQSPLFPLVERAFSSSYRDQIEHARRVADPFWIAPRRAA